MKKIISFSVIAMSILSSCLKTNSISGTAAFTIVNAIPNGNPLLMNFSGSGMAKSINAFNLYGLENQNSGGIGFGSFFELASYTGRTNLTLVQNSDTLNKIFSGTFNFQIGGIYSLYLTGTDTLHVDTLFSKDIIPYFPTTGDSLTGVRFVNLVTGSNPVSVDIAGSPNNTPVLSGLPYKTFSPFQGFSANANAINNGYTFEFRDATSDSLLSTYSLNILPFKSQTLALYGTNANGLSVMEVNNY